MLITPLSDDNNDVLPSQEDGRLSSMDKNVQSTLSLHEIRDVIGFSSSVVHEILSTIKQHKDGTRLVTWEVLHMHIRNFHFWDQRKRRCLSCMCRPVPYESFINEKKSVQDRNEFSKFSIDSAAFRRTVWYRASIFVHHSKRSVHQKLKERKFAGVRKFQRTCTCNIHAAHVCVYVIRSTMEVRCNIRYAAHVCVYVIRSTTRKINILVL